MILSKEIKISCSSKTKEERVKICLISKMISKKKTTQDLPPRLFDQAQEAKMEDLASTQEARIVAITNQT